MQFCTNHWTKLKQAIVDKGLSHLIAQKQEAFENIVNQLENKPTNYDPLMDCHWMIINRALERGGLYLLSLKEDGTQFCPVCEAVTNGATEDNWISGPVDVVFEYCQKEGLVTKH